jgi:prefoldin subunit 5
MNNPRRKALEAVIAAIEEAKETLETLKEEEEESRDNIPENLQGSERYEKADNACDCLDTAASNLEDAIGAINEAIE